MKVAIMQFAGILGMVLMILPGIAAAHCDTMGGPVIKTARKALDTGEITPVLKWVRNDDEKEIRDLFKKTLAVRKLGAEAMALADMYFFETLVRIHRAGEGAPYTGLQPEGAIEPAIEEADKALETGSVDGLVHLVVHAVEEGIKERFRHAKETANHADDSVEAGREFVEAYVVFTHYVERLHMDATAHGPHHKSQHTAGHQHRLGSGRPGTSRPPALNHYSSRQIFIKRMVMSTI